MDARKADALYQDMLQTLTASRLRLQGHFEAGRKEEATAEFGRVFAPAVRNFYAQAAQTAPARFGPDCNWPLRAGQLNNLSLRAYLQLAGGHTDAARSTLKSLRQVFYELHRGLDRSLVNDALFAFRQELARAPAGRRLSLEQIQTLQRLAEAVWQAKPSAAVRREMQAAARAAEENGEAPTTAFQTELQTWRAVLDRGLSPKEVDGADLALLRQATDRFYFKYGLDYQ